MTEQVLNNWQHGEEHDFTGLQEIVDKTVIYDALVARHNKLVSLVPKEITPENEATIRMMMAEIDRNMQELLALMKELEGLCSKNPFFQRQQNTEARSEP
jgi:NADH:ubiquinone oxidoreductase subunit D